MAAATATTTPLLDVFAAELDGGATVTAAFVSAGVFSGSGRYTALLHLAGEIDRGREEVWQWFEGLVPDAAVELIRQGGEAADLAPACRAAALVA